MIFLGSLTGKTALITAAEAGIGRATALAFAREGCRVSAAFGLRRLCELPMAGGRGVCPAAEQRKFGLAVIEEVAGTNLFPSARDVAQGAISLERLTVRIFMTSRAIQILRKIPIRDRRKLLRDGPRAIVLSRGRPSSGFWQRRHGPVPVGNRWPSKRAIISAKCFGRALSKRALPPSISLCWKKRRTAMKKMTTTHLRDQCLSHCTALGIPLESASMDEALARAEKESLSHLQFLDLLLGAQADARRERAVARRIREARFAENKALEGFNWQFNPKAFDRVQIEELATGDFIRRRTNLVMVGWSGVGKRHIIQAVGQKVCVRGYRVMYRTSADLLADLNASLADKTLPARLRRYASPDLLIIDEFGFDRIERTECISTPGVPFTR
jgi:DNA replication protein DnaC